MTDETDQPTVRHYLADDYGSDKHGPLTALVAEQTGGGQGTHTRAIAFKANLDHIHPVLWPTLLAQYGLAEDDTTAPEDLLEERVRQAYRDEGKIAAIRVYRNLTRRPGHVASLSTSKNAVERICESVGSDAR